MFKLWLALYPLVFGPACAVLAGLFTWFVTRGDKPSEAQLLQPFVLALAVLLPISYGITTTQPFLKRFDPATQARQALQVQPSFQAMQKYHAWEWERTEKLAEEMLAAGRTPQQVLSHARRRELPVLQYLLAFTRPSTADAYAGALLPALRELQEKDPALCASAAWPRASEPTDIAGNISAAAAQAYEAAAARVLSENSQARDDRGNPPALPQEARVPETELYPIHLELRETLMTRHGVAPPDLLSSPVQKPPPAAACAAAITMLEKLQTLPPATAGTLARDLLRGG